MINKTHVGIGFFMILFGVGIFQDCYTAVHAGSEKSNITIGFSLGTRREERWLRDQELFTESVKKLGGTVNIKFANNDSSLQISQAENLIMQGVDILVIVPNDGEAAAGIVAMAHKEGIKVIAYDRLIMNCDLDFYISFDNIVVGELQAKSVLSIIQKGDFAYIGGSPNDNNAYLVKRGTFNVIQPKIDNGDIRLVLDKFSEDWRPDKAYENLKAYLEKHRHIDAVICANDGTAFGVIQALQEYGLAGKVPVSGQDAELPACQRIVQGLQTATVYKPIRLLAEKAAQIALSIAQGKNPETNRVIDNGSVKVPSYLIEPIEVTKENMDDTIIKDKFHSREDVYIKNIKK
jgi:D-xylose transport system substrate-binding protein